MHRTKKKGAILYKYIKNYIDKVDLYSKDRISFHLRTPNQFFQHTFRKKSPFTYITITHERNEHQQTHALITTQKQQTFIPLQNFPKTSRKQSHSVTGVDFIGSLDSVRELFAN